MSLRKANDRSEKMLALIALLTPIGGRVHHVLGRDIGAGARTVLDDDMLAETLGKPCAKDARYDVGPATGREADDPVHRPRRIIQRAGGVRKGRKRGRRDVCNHGVAPWSGTPPQKPAAPASFPSCPRNAKGIIAAFQFAELRHVRGSSRIKLHHFPGRCERSHRRIFGSWVSMSAFG